MPTSKIYRAGLQGGFAFLERVRNAARDHGCRVRSYRMQPSPRGTDVTVFVSGPGAGRTKVVSLRYLNLI